MNTNKHKHLFVQSYILTDVLFILYPFETHRTKPNKKVYITQTLYNSVHYRL